MKARRISFLIAAVFGLAIGKADVADSKILSLPDGLLKETQQLSDVKRTVTPTDEGVRVTYSIADILVETSNATKSLYTYMLPDFSISSNPEAPALPGHADSFEVPAGYDAEITLTSSDWTDLKGDVPYGLPLLVESSDKIYTDDDYEKAITSGFSPVEIVTKGDMQNYRGHNIVYVGVNPVQYDSSTSTVRVFHSFTYEVKYVPSVMTLSDDGSSEREYYETGTEMEDASFLQSTLTYALPYDEPMAAVVIPQVYIAPTYLILTVPEFKPAAEKLAKWRELTGYTVEIVCKDNWTSKGIKEYIYNLESAPYAFLLLGNHEKLPAQARVYKAPPYEFKYVTDLYYACWGTMDETDYTPDMYYGRIPVGTLDEANIVIDKIINYERNPVSDQSFYDNVMGGAYFQDDNRDGREDRRFSLTTEEIGDYFTSLGKTNNRVYYADSSVNPQYRDNTIFAFGEPLPSYLKKPNFAWNGNTSDIVNHINNGQHFIYYRGHGSVNGWQYPAFYTSSFSKLSNGNKLPVIFNTTCNTGNFTYKNCFAESILKLKDGGAIAILASTAPSLSKQNDSFAKALINMPWGKPGLRIDIKNDTLKGFKYGSDRSTLMLDAIIRAALSVNRKYIYTPAESLYMEEEYHCFGDPVMHIYIENPEMTTVSPTILNGGKTLSVSSREYADYAFVNNKTGKVHVAKSKKEAQLTLDNPNDIKYISYSVWAYKRKPYIKEGLSYSSLANSSTESKIQQFSISGDVLTVKCEIGNANEATLNLAPVLNENLIQSKTLVTENETDFTQVANGIYVLTLSVDGEIVDTKKIIKN